MSIISVQNLTKQFGSFTAVDQVSFSVGKGEIFGFLGPNGAGKTTTVRMLTGVLRPTSGEIKIDQVDVCTNPVAAQEKMGVVPEMANAYVDASALRNLLIVGQLYGLSIKQAKAESEYWLKQVGLWQHRHKKVKKFSKGMKQKVILAMAMIHKPQLLFLDEPTSGLDVQSVRLIRPKIQEAADQGKTVFLTTHNLEEANQLCDRIAIINHGKIIKVDRPSRLKKMAKKELKVEASFSRPLKQKLQLNQVQAVEKSGDRWILTTSSPGEVIAQLVDTARENNNPLVSVNTKQPSLEQVFVELTRDNETS